jgi:hypothetical protein
VTRHTSGAELLDDPRRVLESARRDGSIEGARERGVER